MKTISLNGTWQLTYSGDTCDGQIPGSVYSFLLAANKMPDPHYRDNELRALPIMDDEFTFTRSFALDKDWLSSGRVLLRCEGLDTLCTLLINGVSVGRANNMHRIWEYDVTDALQTSDNTLSVVCASPTLYIKDAVAADPIGGSPHAMRGFPHLRKAHCMFGWDWGPRLPDAGIWRDITLLHLSSPRIVDAHIRQRHQDGAVWVTVDAAAAPQAKDLQARITIAAPGGQTFTGLAGEPIAIAEPQLWWPNGYGAQPLYTVHIQLLQNGAVADSLQRRIGLRTMTVVHDRDRWGESFAQCVNGVQMFAMGADYIPEDNLLSRVTPARTRKLLEQCVAAHFNSLRVWGGGYYPDDFFFDICDELGLVVWQDFMFACANYHLTGSFEENIRAEFYDNVRRIRHHACLGLWCGNNEMEMFQAIGEYGGTPKTRSDYIRMFEHIIPEVLRQADPDTFYWPASPSSGGGFDEPNDASRGDVHYWDVWHGGKPFADYRKFFFRYVSEFGFQSFPSLRTVESFTLPEERNIFSRTMEMHQRNEGANGKIMNYLSQTFLYPNNFEILLYASQLLQAEAIRYGVEHWRRHRGRCMGAIYWQLNDIWPVASWASIDYFGRWKALHYAAKRFFAPVMISCEEVGETTERPSVVMQPSPVQTSARLCVANETRLPVRGTARWTLRENSGRAIQGGEQVLDVPALSSVWLDNQVFEGLDFHTHYFSYAFIVEDEEISCGSVLFTAPKHFHFLDPELTLERHGDRITLRAAAYARSVELYSPDEDLVLSDNFFDMDAGEMTVRILEGDPQEIRARCVYHIR